MIAHAQAPATLPDCASIGGSAKRNTAEWQLNVLKNRFAAPSHCEKIPLDSILADGNDVNRFDNSDAVWIDGYITGVKKGGKESCNCDKPDLLDTHIYIGKTPDAKPNECMICEITPRWRATLHLLTSDVKKWIGKEVVISGWMLADTEHKGQSVNTAKKGAKCWRKTFWEVHPVTNIDLASH